MDVFLIFAVQVMFYAVFPFYFATLNHPFRLIFFYLYISIILVVGGFLSAVYSLPLSDTVIISGGSLAYGALMMSTLLFFIAERDLRVIRNVIRIVVAVNIFKFLLFSMISWALSSNIILNPFDTSPSVFRVSLGIVILGGALIIFELLLLIFLFEGIKTRLRDVKLSSILFTMSFTAILCLDGILFPLIATPFDPELVSIMIGGVKGKFVMGLTYSIPIVIFLFVFRKNIEQYDLTPIRLKELFLEPKENLIQEIERQHQALQVSEETYRHLAESIGDIFFSMDADMRFTYWNKASEATGYTREEAIGKTLYDLFPQTKGTPLEEFYKEVLITQKAGQFINQIQLGNQNRYYEITAYPFRGGISVLAHDMTKRKQAEEVAKASEERLRLTFEAAKIGTGELDLLSNQISLSNPMQRVLGLPPDTFNLTFEEYTELVHPEDRARVRQVVEDSIAGQPDIALDYRIVWPDGSVHWVTSRAKTFYDETGRATRIVGAIMDITDRKQAEEAIQESEERLRLTFEAAKIGTGELDLQTNQVTFSTPLQRVLGLAPGTFNPTLGGYIERVHPEDRALVRQAVEDTIADQSDIAVDYRIVWPDGSVHWVTSRTKAFYDEAGKATRIVGAVMDITDRKRAEEELRELNEELEQRVAERTEALAAAMGKAQESDRLKSAFLATMSHELRTPLHSILGFTDVVLQGRAGPVSEEQSKHLKMARDSARHLLALINDILDISKIEAGQLKIVKHPFDMRQAIESALQVVQPLLQKKGLQLKTSIGPGVGMIDQDRRRVEQVLINLITNAVKFTERGEVRVECQIKNGRLETSVHDTGMGIQREDLHRLFKPFQQINTGPARSHEGTGLGLAICKRLVVAMDGEITVESQWGVGSTFTFTLPIHARNATRRRESENQLL